MLTTSTKLKQGCRLIFAKVVNKTWPKFQFLQQPESHVRNSVKWCPGSSLVVNSSSRQHHGVVVRPLGRVAPPLLRVVPEMAACGVPHNPLGETLPHGEGKIHLQTEHKPNKQSSVNKCQQNITFPLLIRNAKSWDCWETLIPRIHQQIKLTAWHFAP